MVKWLVAGGGDIARKRVIPAILAEPRSSLAGVVTRNAAKAQAYPGVRAWPTLEAALQESAVERSAAWAQITRDEGAGRRPAYESAVGDDGG